MNARSEEATTMKVTSPAAVLLLLVPLSAGAFEGTVKLRTVSMPRDKLAAVTGASTAPSAEQAMTITPAQMVAAKDAKPTVYEGTVFVSGSKVRMDLPSETGGYAVIDTAKDTTWFVVPKDKRYIEWSEADAQAMGAKMAQLEKMMKEKMASLPPDQQQQVAAMMKNLKQASPDEPPPNVSLKPLDKTETINGMQASAFEVVGQGDAKMVGWVTSAQPELAAALRTVQQRMQKMTPANLRGRESGRTALSEKGLPVRVQSLEGDRYRVEEVVAVEPGTVKADLFTVPAEYTKTTGREALKGIPDK
jgi:hypothetical protein